MKITFKRRKVVWKTVLASYDQAVAFRLFLSNAWGYYMVNWNTAAASEVELCAQQLMDKWEAIHKDGGMSENQIEVVVNDFEPVNITDFFKNRASVDHFIWFLHNKMCLFYEQSDPLMAEVFQGLINNIESLRGTHNGPIKK